MHKICVHFGGCFEECHISHLLATLVLSRTTFGFVWMLTVILNSGAGAKSVHGANTVVGSRSESTGSAVVRQVLNLLEGTNDRSTSVFVRAVARMLHVYSMWGCGFSCMRRVCGRVFVRCVLPARTRANTCRHVPIPGFTVPTEF